EKICEFDKEAELGHADNQAIEIFADTILHELGFFPFHQLALGIVGAPLGLARFFGDRVQFLERDGTVCEDHGFTFATFGPGGSSSRRAVPPPRALRAWSRTRSIPVPGTTDSRRCAGRSVAPSRFVISRRQSNRNLPVPSLGRIPQNVFEHAVHNQ